MRRRFTPNAPREEVVNEEEGYCMYYLSICIRIASPICCLFLDYIYRCFKGLGPWCNSNDLSYMFVSKVIVTTIATEIRIHVISLATIPLVLFYFPSS